MLVNVLSTMIAGLGISLMSAVEASPCPADAVTVDVTTAADAQHLADAMNCTGGGIFNVAWHSSLRIGRRIDVSNMKTVTITGYGSPVIGAGMGDDNDTGGATGLFYVSEGSNLSLNHLVLDGGAQEDGGAVAVLSSSVLRVFDCNFTNNNASTGGAIFSSGSDIYADGNTVFANNTADLGGAVFASHSVIHFDGRPSFQYNSAGAGGAVFADESEIYINGTTSFEHNSAKGALFASYDGYAFTGLTLYLPSSAIISYGGAIYVNSSAIHVDGTSSFSHGSAYIGGSMCAVRSEVFMNGSTSFTNNGAGNAGGAIFLGLSEIYMDGSTQFSNDVAWFAGGAVHGDSSNISMNGKTDFTNNYAYDFGGAIYLDSSNIYMGGSTDISNGSAAAGGAVFADYSSEVYMDGSNIFFNNSARSAGGAFVFSDKSDFFIHGITEFANNTAVYSAGAILATQSSSIYLYGRTKFSNSFAGSGGVVDAIDSTVYIIGSAEFANNSAQTIGGAIRTWYAEIVIDGSTIFSYNSAAGDGGAVYTQWSEISINCGAIFNNNSATGRGGAIFQQNSELGIKGSAVFSHNSATDGGGALYSFSSETKIEGSATFSHNSAASDGGAIYVRFSNFSSAGSKMGEMPGSEGGSCSEVVSGYAPTWPVAFFENSATGLGGAMCIEDADQVHVSSSAFKSNEAQLGGAVYATSSKDEDTVFNMCNFESNRAADGGAIYLFTLLGSGLVNSSIFRDNFAEYSGGAIFHTGSLRVVNSSFVANEAGVEGVAVISIGLLDELSNVSFSGNTFYCRAGDYGYIIENESVFCASCFDEVCARCSTGYRGVITGEDVRTDGLPVCAEPPAGSISVSSGTTVATLTLKKGYYRTSNQSHTVLKCFQENACLGGNDTAEYCAFGYEGPFCAVCAKGFSPGIGHSCRECRGSIRRSSVGLTLAVGLALTLMTAVILRDLGSVVLTRADEDMEVSRSSWKQRLCSCQTILTKMLPLTAIKIVVTVWQIIYQFDAIAGDIYPELYKTFIGKLGPVNFDVDFVLAYSCLVTTDFYDRLLFATIAPLLVLAILAGSYVIGVWRNRSSDVTMQTVRHKHQAALLYVAFVVYSPVSFKIFQTFSCDELDDGTTYLRADYSLDCLTTRHSAYKAYAVFMVCVYPVGIAAVFVWLLLRHRRDLVKPDRETMAHLQPFHGMWAAYRPSRYYYEVIECGRRIALTGIAAFVLPNSTAQIAIALLFAVVFVFISEAISPFKTKVDTNLYRWGNGIIVASMYVAFLMKVDVGRDTTEALLTFSGVLIAANVFMVVTVLLQAALFVKEWCGVNETVRVVDVPVRRTP